MKPPEALLAGAPGCHLANSVNNRVPAAMRDVSVKHEDLKGAGVLLRDTCRFRNFMHVFSRVLEIFLVRKTRDLLTFPENHACFTLGARNFAPRDFGVRGDCCLRQLCRREVAEV